MTFPVDLLPLSPGLVAITGNEGTGKTTLLSRIGKDPPALWLDLSAPMRSMSMPG